METPELDGVDPNIIDPIKLDHLDCILESLHDMLRVTMTIERELSGSQEESQSQSQNNPMDTTNPGGHMTKSQKEHMLGRLSSKDSVHSQSGLGQSGIINPLKSMDGVSVRPVRITTTAGASYDLSENVPSLVRLASGRSSPVPGAGAGAGAGGLGGMDKGHTSVHSGGGHSGDREERSVNSTSATVVAGAGGGGGGGIASGTGTGGKQVPSMKKLIKIAGFTSPGDLLQWRHLANQLYLPYEVVLLHAKKRLCSILNEFRGDVIDPEIIKSMC